MKMLMTIAWKNIWRNKTRSGVVITAIVLGLWAGTFLIAYAFGMMNQRLKDAIENEVSHIQIQNPKYLVDYEPVYDVKNVDQLVNVIRGSFDVKGISARSYIIGMIASPNSSTGGRIVGVDPDAEQITTGLKDKVIEGEYLKENDRNKILIGKKLAEKLKVKLRSKVVVTFQDTTGTISAIAYRVKGIYESYNKSMEQSHVYTTNKNIQNALGVEAHELAILLNDADGVSTAKKMLSSTYPDLSVRDWKEIAPELRLMIDSLDQYMIIFLVIILLALSFGIVNTMLMAVLERVKEIGMLMAIGMNKTRLFLMISLETIFLMIVSAPIGMLLAMASINYLGTVGIDLTDLMKDAYTGFGFKPIIYPSLSGEYYFRIMVLVMITALLASIYPAITALKLDPVKAIRKL